MPLTEIALMLGLGVIAYGLTRAQDRGSVLVGIGVLMSTAGVIELCSREHFSGFKPHTLLLAFLPTVAMHTVLRTWVSTGYAGPVSLLADLAVFTVLAMVLLDRYRNAGPLEAR